MGRSKLVTETEGGPSQHFIVCTTPSLQDAPLDAISSKGALATSRLCAPFLSRLNAAKLVTVHLSFGDDKFAVHGQTCSATGSTVHSTLPVHGHGRPTEAWLQLSAHTSPPTRSDPT